MTSIGRLADAEDRRRITENLDATLFVEAAAGTGKTTALVARIVSLVRRGRARLDRIVAVTFTEKAAGEMKLRLRAGIEEARTSPDVDGVDAGYLEAAIGHLELARIGTIHAFCSDLLRERPVEAGVDPAFTVAVEGEVETLLDRAFAAWFEGALASPPEGTRRILRRRRRRRDDLGPSEMLRGAAATLAYHRDFNAAWRRDPFDRERELDRVIEALRNVAGVAAGIVSDRTYLAKSFLEVARFVEEVDLLEGLRGRDYDGLESDLRRFARERHWRWRGSPKGSLTPNLSNLQGRERRDAAKAELDRVLAGCDADLAPCLREELRPVITAYEAAKAKEGKLDFLDLLVRARDLIRDDAIVRSELQERFTHVFVDEFQDTDPLQAEILLLLAADNPAETDWHSARPVPGKLFVVGDPKQSIYRFRRADVSLYEQVKRRLLDQGAVLARLRASFRARPSIQAVINAAFAPAMSGDTSEDSTQATYVALEPVREDETARPTVIVVPVPRPYGDFGSIVSFRIDESFADAIGAFIDWVIRKSGWTVEERGKPVAVAPRHICVLFRRFRSGPTDVTRPYVRALEARRLPHVLVGGHSFHDREEVLALRNALFATEWVDDELRVFATMRGPLFAVQDDALLAFRHRHGSLRPLAWGSDEKRGALEGDERAVADALAVIARLHVRRNRRSIAETVTALLGEVRAHAGLAIWPTGEQALANVLWVVELARTFERGGAPSYRGFVESLERDAEEGRVGEIPVVEEGTEGVRLMTVHRAKGLEFPIVILADPTCRATARNPSRHIDTERNLWVEPLCGAVPPELGEASQDELRRDTEEAVRVAYVAATRARDLLVVPGIGDLAVGDDLVSGWLETLNPVIYPKPALRRRPGSPPGCPTFSDDTTIDRPLQVTPSPAGPIAPGLHEAGMGDGAVVWWDPASLVLDVEEEVGLRQQRILEAGQGGTIASSGVDAHSRWRASRREAIVRSSEPSIRVAPVTTIAAINAAEAPIGVTVEEVVADRTERPSGKRFGTLVHAILATVDLTAGEARLVRQAEGQGRLVGASPDEIDAAIEAVGRALEHDWLARAGAAGRRGELRRETPLLVRLDDGTLAEGIVDLAFREEVPGGWEWTVVDFKTDRELSGRVAECSRQVALYARAIEAATGTRARPYLLVV